MDMVTASMCLYLLFPIVNERQNQYATLLKRTPQTDSEFVMQKLSLEKFIGLGNTDEKLSLEYSTQQSVRFRVNGLAYWL